MTGKRSIGNWELQIVARDLEVEAELSRASVKLGGQHNSEDSLGW